MVRTFLQRLVIFTALLLGLLAMLSYMTDKGLSVSKDGDYGPWNDIYHSSINADLLILGSSRAHYHFSPAILDSALGIQSYDLGMNGWPFAMQYARLKIYLQHNRKPAYIVQSLDDNTLDTRKDLFAYEQFVPYLSDTLIRNACKGYQGEFNDLDYYIPYFKYTHNPNASFVGLSRFFTSFLFQSHSYTDLPQKGYHGAVNQWDHSFDSFVTSNTLHSITLTTDPKTVQDFKEYLAYCAQNNIKVIFVYSPEYFKVFPYYRNMDSIMAMYKNYSGQYHIPLLDYRNDPLCLQKKYFFNSQHLNKAGAEIFSRELADTLKNLIASPGKGAQLLGDR